MRYIYGEVAVRKRRRLPHWHVRNGLYLITFRLADSLPAEVRERLEELRRRDPRAFRMTIEDQLDRGDGEAVLLRPDAAKIVKGALEYFHRDRYLLICSTVMPNHVHVVLQLLGDHQLDQVLGSLKRYTARSINELLHRRGRLWQEEYFDTLIRSEEHLERAVRYVLANPAKAGYENHAWTELDPVAYGELLGLVPDPS